MILIPAGFHRFRFQPSTHIAPKLRRETVPSPSPSLMPFRTCVVIWSYHTQISFTTFSSWADPGIRAFLCVLPIDPATGKRLVSRRVKVLLGTCVVLRAYLNIHCLADIPVFIGFRGVPIRRQSTPTLRRTMSSYQYDLCMSSRQSRSNSTNRVLTSVSFP